MERECGKAKLSDDMFIGYVSNGILDVTLHESHLLHSHIENLKRSMNGLDIKRQVGDINSCNVMASKLRFKK